MLHILFVFLCVLCACTKSKPSSTSPPPTHAASSLVQSSNPNACAQLALAGTAPLLDPSTLKIPSAQVNPVRIDTTSSLYIPEILAQADPNADLTYYNACNPTQGCFDGLILMPMTGKAGWYGTFEYRLQADTAPYQVKVQGCVRADRVQPGTTGIVIHPTRYPDIELHCGPTYLGANGAGLVYQQSPFPNSVLAGKLLALDAQDVVVDNTLYAMESAVQTFVQQNGAAGDQFTALLSQVALAREGLFPLAKSTFMDQLLQEAQTNTSNASLSLAGNTSSTGCATNADLNSVNINPASTMTSTNTSVASQLSGPVAVASALVAHTNGGGDGVGNTVASDTDTGDTTVIALPANATPVISASASVTASVSTDATALTVTWAPASAGQTGDVLLYTVQLQAPGKSPLIYTALPTSNPLVIATEDLNTPKNGLPSGTLTVSVTAIEELGGAQNSHTYTTMPSVLIPATATGLAGSTTTAQAPTIPASSTVSATVTAAGLILIGWTAAKQTQAGDLLQYQVVLTDATMQTTYTYVSDSNAISIDSKDTSTYTLPTNQQALTVSVTAVEYVSGSSQTAKYRMSPSITLGASTPTVATSAEVTPTANSDGSLTLTFPAATAGQSWDALGYQIELTAPSATIASTVIPSSVANAAGTITATIPANAIQALLSSSASTGGSTFSIQVNAVESQGNTTESKSYPAALVSIGAGSGGSGEGGLSKGATAGIIIGSVVGAIVLVGLGIYAVKTYRTSTPSAGVEAADASASPRVPTSPRPPWVEAYYSAVENGDYETPVPSRGYYAPTVAEGTAFYGSTNGDGFFSILKGSVPLPGDGEAPVVPARPSIARDALPPNAEVVDEAGDARISSVAAAEADVELHAAEIASSPQQVFISQLNALMQTFITAKGTYLSLLSDLNTYLQAQ